MTTLLSEWLKYKIVTTSKAGKDAEKMHHSCIAGGNVKLYSYSGKQLGSFLQN